jgi:hypothetical protein
MQVFCQNNGKRRGRNLIMNAAPWLLRRVVWQKFTDVHAVCVIMAITLIMEAADISETSVNVYQTTRRNNPEGSHLLTGGINLWRKNLRPTEESVLK